MKYQIIGKNIEITEGISDAIEKKMSKMDKYFLINDDVLCRAVCSTHVGVQKVEVTIFLPRINLRAEVRDPDLYAAIDSAIDKLEGQMRKLKTRMEELGNLKGLEWYLDLRKYGGCPHSGFGIGFDRLLMYVTGMGNIRDVQPFPRTSNQIKY